MIKRATFSLFVMLLFSFRAVLADEENNWDINTSLHIGVYLN